MANKHFQETWLPSGPMESQTRSTQLHISIRFFQQLNCHLTSSKQSTNEARTLKNVQTTELLKLFFCNPFHNYHFTLVLVSFNKTCSFTLLCGLFKLPD